MTVGYVKLTINVNQNKFKLPDTSSEAVRKIMFLYLAFEWWQNMVTLARREAIAI